MRPIKQDAIQNDLRLLEMALYETTKGQTYCTSQVVIVKKVTEYKRLIKRGTFTVDELEDRIFSRYGIIDERSKADTEIYDARKEMVFGTGPNSLGGLFSQLVRKSQEYKEQLELKQEQPLTEDEVKELDELDRLAESDRLNNLDKQNEQNELDELDDQFEQDWIDEDFPKKEDPEDDLPFQFHKFHKFHKFSG